MFVRVRCGQLYMCMGNHQRDCATDANYPLCPTHTNTHTDFAPGRSRFPQNPVSSLPRIFFPSPFFTTSEPVVISVFFRYGSISKLHRQREVIKLERPRNRKSLWWCSWLDALFNIKRDSRCRFSAVMKPTHRRRLPAITVPRNFPDKSTG